LRRRNAAVAIATVSMTLLVAAACVGLIDVTSSSVHDVDVDAQQPGEQRSANDCRLISTPATDGIVGANPIRKRN